MDWSREERTGPGGALGELSARPHRTAVRRALPGCGALLHPDTQPRPPRRPRWPTVAFGRGVVPVVAPLAGNREGADVSWSGRGPWKLVLLLADGHPPSERGADMVLEHHHQLQR